MSPKLQSLLGFTTAHILTNKLHQFLTSRPSFAVFLWHTYIDTRIHGQTPLKQYSPTLAETHDKKKTVKPEKNDKRRFIYLL